VRDQIGHTRLVHGTAASAEIVSQGIEACNTVVQFFAVEIFRNANLGDVELDWAHNPVGSTTLWILFHAYYCRKLSA
jgi:hypothetical protein